jgi:myo-inositol-1-phosphate synthase
LVVDFTPSTGSALPALNELARSKSLPCAGRGGKTGETLLRAALVPMLTSWALRVLSWAGTTLRGGGDGRQASGATGVAALLGHGTTTPLHVDHVPDLGERGTAQVPVSFEGFPGTRMSPQLTWNGLGSSPAAPLVLDLVRLVAAAHAAGRVGAQEALAFFFDDPLGSDEHQFAERVRELHEWARGPA